MAKEASKTVQCIVDDTALTANITEIENWVARGAIAIVLPLYTIERLHLLKKDASQIGQNARRTVKFLDKMTSDKVDLPNEPIIIQGPDEQYATWQEVETHYRENATGKPDAKVDAVKDPEHKKATDTAAKRTSGSALSQMLLDKLNFAPQPSSPGSTPPLSPTSSGPQSSKTSPEVRIVTMAAVDKSPVPPVLKPLLNPVVWYVHEKRTSGAEVFFLTNSADTQHLARDFNVPTKTIHQMRSTIKMESSAPLNSAKGDTKRPPSSNLAEPENKTLFSYEDESGEEEDEVVVFKPRGRGAVIGSNGRGSLRGKNNRGRSPRPSFSAGNVATPSNTDANGSPLASQNKPKIPIEEIDPDSFDRGSFGRGSGQLANVGNHVGNHNIPKWAPNGPSRGSPVSRATSNAAGRGHQRGRGAERGASAGRGRGRLFVP